MFVAIHYPLRILSLHDMPLTLAPNSVFIAMAFLVNGYIGKKPTLLGDPCCFILFNNIFVLIDLSP